MFVLGAVVIAISTAVAAVPKADHTTSWVLDLITVVPLDQLHEPFWQPPPLSIWSFRPVSVLLMRASAALLDGALVPGWWMAVKTALGSLALAAAAVGFLRAHGLAREAPLAAVGCLALSPTLFSLWYLTELDHLTAAATLGGLAALRLGRRPLHLVLAALGLAIAVLTKESSALVCFAFLCGGGAVAALSGSRALALRYGVALMLLGAPWLVSVSAMMGSAQSALGATPLSGRLPLLEHNLVQFGYLATPAGAVAVAVGVARRLPGIAGRLAPLAGVGLLIGLPLLTVTNHYETVYHHSRGAGTALALLLMIGLVAIGIRRSTSGRHAGPATAAVSVVATFVTIDVALLASSSPREDMAARIFLPTAPLVLALALSALREAWGRMEAPWEKPPLLVLGAALAWAPLAHLFNTCAEWTARHPVEMAGRAALVAADPAGAPVLFNHFQNPVGPEELAAMAGRDVELRPVPLTAWLRTAALPDEHYAWSDQDASLEAAFHRGEPLFLFWQAARAEVEPEAGAVLAGDLSWIRRPMGALTGGEDMGAGNEVLPEHSFIEDVTLVTYRPGPTPLEALAASTGTSLFAQTGGYGLVPLNLLDLPRRVLSGVPWWVPMRAEVVLWRLQREGS